MLNKSIKSFFSFLITISMLCSNAWATPSAFNAGHAGTFEHHHHFQHASSTSTTPFDITIVDGKGHIKQFGNVTIIWISSPNAIVEGNISTNLGDIVKIFMKAAGDTTVLESNTGFTTFADGHYYSNATLLFLNTAGFVFGPSSQVKAANLAVSTLNISNTDLLAGLSSGKYNFTGQGTYIINDGKLIAQPGGYIALLSGAISNGGTIQAKLGKIVLASGDGMTLTTVDLDDNSTIFVAIDKAVENEICDPAGNKITNAINNSGTISANGGTITLTAKSLNTIFDNSINNTGIIQANSLSSTQKGDVVLKASGVVSTTGTLETSSLFERGSTLQVGGVFDPGVANIKNADNAVVFSADTDISATIEDAVNIIIDPNVVLTMTGDTSFIATTGSFLMDPTATINGGGYNLTITAADDVALGNINDVSSLTATATTGDLTVASPISANGGNISLTAGQDIDQESSIDTTDGGVYTGGNYTGTAGSSYILNYDLTTAPSITTGDGVADVAAPTVAEVGSGWGFTSDTETSNAWEYLGGLRGGSLLQFGYYFLLGNTIVYVPAVSDFGGNIDSPVSGTQNFININTSGTTGGGYIVSQYETGPVYYWYTNSALNEDGYNHVIADSLSDEAAQLESTASISDDGYSTVMAWIPSLIATASTDGGTIYNWEDGAFPGTDGDYNDVIIQNLATTTNALIITAQNQTSTYGTGLPSSTAVDYAGFINGNTAASLTTQPTVSTAATAASDVGNYGITASGAVDPNYSIFYVPGTFSITPASLTITPNNQSTVYGTPTLPNLTLSYAGFVNGETSANLTTQPTVTTTATPTSNVGDYAITASGAIDSNYTISYVPGTLAVTPASLTVTANNQSTVYGTPTLPTLSVGYTGFVNGDTSASLTTQPTVTTTATATSNVGNYAITASGAVDSNYTISYVAGTLAITPASLTVTANNQSTVYGTPTLPTLSVGYTGFVNGDTSASLTTQPTVTTTATPTSNVGNYAITASGAVDPNYTISYVPGTLAVTPAGLTITANNQSTVYGTPTLPTLSVGYTGFVNGDTSASLTTQPTVTTTATATSNVGNYAITASGAVDPNYTISYVPGTLAITPASLTVTANNQSTVYGTPTLPTLTVGYTGFVNGDTSASLTTQPTVTTTATPTSNVGNYAITASGAADSNYTISYVPGTLAVTPASLTVTANNQSTVYGTPTLPTLSVGYTGFVNGDTSASLTTQPTVTTTATPTSNVGNYAITASGAVDPNYTISYVAGSLAVTPASLTVTANNQSTVYGTPTLPTLTVGYTGFVNGDTSASLTTQPTVTTTATSASNVGNYAITASGAVDSNYTISYVAGSLAVTPAPLTITANNQTTVAGTPTLPALTVGYTGFVNGDTSTSLTTQPTVTTTATPASPAGNYAITASGAFDPNYNISYVAGILNVTPGTVTPPTTPSFNAFGVFDTNNKVNKIIYETLSPYQLSTNTIQQPLVYFYHPLTPIDQSAFDGISLDEGAYDFIENSLQLNKAPASYYGVQ